MVLSENSGTTAKDKKSLKPETEKTGEQGESPKKTPEIPDQQALEALASEKKSAIDNTVKKTTVDRQQKLEAPAIALDLDAEDVAIAKQETGIEGQLDQIQEEIGTASEQAKVEIDNVAHENTEKEKPMEARPEYTLKSLNEMIDSASVDVYDKKMTDEQYEAKYGSSRTETIVVLKELVAVRETRFISNEFLAVNEKARVIDEAKGIYAFQLPNGELLHGSIYSIIDAHDKLSEVSPMAGEIQSREGADANAVIGIQVREGEGYKSIIVASGSFAQREVVPFPADMDFAEHLDIQAETKEAAAKKLAALITETFIHTEGNENLQFVDLKCGIYPDDAPETIIGWDGKPTQARGKEIWWEKDEVPNGEKTITDAVTGQKYTITLAKAAENPGMTKINWLAMQEGNLTEVTKVINVKATDTQGNEFFNNREKSSAFQEVYFGEISDFGLTEELRDPAVLKEYTDFLRRDVAHYSDPSDPNSLNYLKAAKRSYNLQKVQGNLPEARKIAELFSSATGELAARAESINLLAKYLKAPSGKFEPSTFVKQIENIGGFIAADTSLFSNEQRQEIQQKLETVKKSLADGAANAAEVSAILSSLGPLFKETVNRSAKEFIDKQSNPEKQRESTKEETEQPNFEFEMKDGKAKRITIESNVVPSAETTRLQEALKEAFPEMKLENVDWLHVTLGHLGTPDDLFSELQKVNPAIERAQFDKRFQQVLAKSEQSMPENVQATGTELAQFNGGAIVLKLDKTPFETANVQVYNETVAMLKDLGIKDPVDYIKKSTPDSSNLHFMQPDRFQPHITLGKIPPEQKVDLSSITPGAETIEFAPSHIYNAKKIIKEQTETSPSTDE